MQTNATTRDVSPARALRRPVWWIALIVLATNDQILKGAGWLPGFVTGKLSDFAGLLVAPILLATIFRVDSRRGWYRSLGSVGVVFAAIKLSVTASDAFTATLGRFGISWTNWVDPTDLAALGMLAVADRLVRPRAGLRLRTPAAPRRTRAEPVRALRWTAMAVGLPVVLGSGGDPIRIEWDSDSDWFGSCPDLPVSGPIVGERADGRLDLTAREAWPARGEEPPPLTASEVARACAAFEACQTATDASAQSFQFHSFVRAGCHEGETFALFSTNREQRAIPLPGVNERWSFFLREVLAAGGDCDTILSIETDAPEPFRCQEDGCWWEGPTPPSVTCDDTVAIIRHGGVETRRDCARSYTVCDPASPTGCTDRQLLRCTSDAILDRCDGDIRLGCDECGLVSFRDCSWNGGTCVETPDGARCESPPEVCEGPSFECDSTRYTECVFGEAVTIDCADFGMTCESAFPADTAALPHCTPLGSEPAPDGGASPSGGGFSAADGQAEAE